MDEKLVFDGIGRLAERIRDEIFIPVNTYKTTIFLCGADLNEEKGLRGRIAKELTSIWNSYFYDIIYPEEIFDELMYGYKAKDLLSLENMLAESVDAILIIPESPGSFTELGAFANDERLRDKIICIQDEKYKKEKSFINYGPIRLIQKSKTGQVIFISPALTERGIAKIKTALSKLKKNSSKMPSCVSLMQLENYLLPTVYLMEPVQKGILEQMVAKVISDPEHSFHKTTTALTMLAKKNYISITPDGYCLTNLGLESFNELKKSGKHKISIETQKLDSLRLDIMNWKYRGKKIAL
jgi:hypothetical protein